MYKIRQDLNIYPPAKSNGDTNRELVDIEIALAREFHFEKNIVVFNVHGESWVLPLFHECDMIVVSPKTRLLSEFEIKRTWSDFCADFKKNHRHEAYNGLDVASFSYVVPEGLFEKVIKKLQSERIVVTSVITYDEQLNFTHHMCLYSLYPKEEGRTMASTYHGVNQSNLKAEQVRKGVEDGRYFTLHFSPDNMPTIIPKANAHPLFTEQMMEIMRLGCMRQVSLREKLSKLIDGLV